MDRGAWRATVRGVDRATEHQLTADLKLHCGGCTLVCGVRPIRSVAGLLGCCLEGPGGYGCGQGGVEWAGSRQQ